MPPRPRDALELNYYITQLCTDYLQLNNKRDYGGYNEAIGVLECVKLELYRRMVTTSYDVH